MCSDAEQESDYDARYRRLYATRKRQGRDGGRSEIKRDGNEVGDRYHSDRLI